MSELARTEGDENEAALQEALGARKYTFLAAIQLLTGRFDGDENPSEKIAQFFAEHDFFRGKEEK